MNLTKEQMGWAENITHMIMSNRFDVYFSDCGVGFDKTLDTLRLNCCSVTQRSNGQIMFNFYDDCEHKVYKAIKSYLAELRDPHFSPVFSIHIYGPDHTVVMKINVQEQGDYLRCEEPPIDLSWDYGLVTQKISIVTSGMQQVIRERL